MNTGLKVLIVSHDTLTGWVEIESGDSAAGLDCRAFPSSCSSSLVSDQYVRTTCRWDRARPLASVERFHQPRTVCRIQRGDEASEEKACATARRGGSGERLPPSTGNPDRAGVMHEFGGLGHVHAGRSKEQQHSGGDDGEVDAIHGRQTMGPDIVPMLLHTYLMKEESEHR